MSSTKQQKNKLNFSDFFRKIHRPTGACLFIFSFISIWDFIGWKKNSNGLLLQKLKKNNFRIFKWLPLDVLYQKAYTIFKILCSEKTIALDRVDIRKQGFVKFIFDDYTDCKLDGGTGSF